MLNKENIDYSEIVVSDEELNELQKRTNMTTVPQIFAGDNLVGGCDDLYKLYQDKTMFYKTFFD